MHQTEQAVEQAHHTTYGTYIKVWLGLVVFTGITVTVAGIDLQSATLTVAVALMIASVKTMLVVYFFMHIKYESLFFKVMLLVCALTFLIFIGLTFFDVSFR